MLSEADRKSEFATSATASGIHEKFTTFLWIKIATCWLSWNWTLLKGIRRRRLLQSFTYTIQSICSIFGRPENCAWNSAALKSISRIDKQHTCGWQWIKKLRNQPQSKCLTSMWIVCVLIIGGRRIRGWCFERAAHFFLSASNCAAPSTGRDPSQTADDETGRRGGFLWSVPMIGIHKRTFFSVQSTRNVKFQAPCTFLSTDDSPPPQPRIVAAAAECND